MAPHPPAMLPPARTALPTDIVNRFAEVVMLLDLAIDEPSAMDEIRPWRTVTYRDHFGASVSGRAREALAAYAALPDADRRALDQAIAELDAASAGVLEEMEQARGAQARLAVRDRWAAELAVRIARLQGLLAGSPDGGYDPQASIDDLFGA